MNGHPGLKHSNLPLGNIVGPEPSLNQTGESREHFNEMLKVVLTSGSNMADYFVNNSKKIQKNVCIILDVLCKFVRGRKQNEKGCCCGLQPKDCSSTSWGHKRGGYGEALDWLLSLYGPAGDNNIRARCSISRQGELRRPWSKQTYGIQTPLILILYHPSYTMYNKR